MPKSWLETGPEELYSVSGDERDGRSMIRRSKTVQYYIGVNHISMNDLPHRTLYSAMK